MTELCQWNPELSKPAVGHRGCPNEATVAVGGRGQWLLCEGCAKSPAFSHLRKRTPLKPERKPKEY